MITNLVGTFPIKEKKQYSPEEITHGKKEKKMEWNKIQMKIKRIHQTKKKKRLMKTIPEKAKKRKIHARHFSPKTKRNPTGLKEKWNSGDCTQSESKKDCKCIKGKSSQNMRMHSEESDR